jgi:DNA polymerase-3 subunit epsilon
MKEGKDMICPSCKKGELRLAVGKLVCNRFPVCRHTEAAPAGSSAAGLTYVVVDYETTGTSNSAKIIEIGAAKVRDGVIVDEFSTFVNPEMYISPIITEITGITNADLMGKPTEREVFPKFMAWLEDVDLFVAHNLPFEARMTKETCKRLGIPNFQGNGICTLALARKVLPGQSHRLGDLCAYFGIPLSNAHRAIYDVRATVRLAEILMKNDQFSPRPFSEFCKG